MPFSVFLAYCNEQERYERSRFADRVLATNIGSHAKPERIDSLVQSLRA